jgi:RNase P subunit RPR2
MAVDQTRTIGDIALHGGMLEARCRACGHVGKVNPVRLPARYQSLAVSAVRFRCAECGARGEVTLTRRRSHRNQSPTPNEQRVGSLYATGCDIGAICSGCEPFRTVDFSLEEIARQLGEPDPLVREACRKLVCPYCRSPLLPSVGSVSAARVGRVRLG